MVLCLCTAWFCVCILHGFVFVYCMVLCLYTAWFCVGIPHGFLFVYCMVLLFVWFSVCILHGFVFVYSMVLCLCTAWFCVCILHGFVLVGYVFVYCMGFVFVYCLLLCLDTSVIPKQGGLDYQAKSTDVAKLAFRTATPCSLTVCWRTHDDMFVTEVLDSVIFGTFTLRLNLC